MSARDLIALVADVSATLNSVADQLTLFQVSDVVRAVKQLWDQEQLQEIITTSHPGRFSFSSDALANLVYAIIVGAGTPNRMGNELSMAQLGLKLARMSVGEVAYQSAEAEPRDVAHLEFLIAAGLWSDIQSCYEEELSSDEPNRPLSDDSRSRAIAERTSLLKQAATTFLGLLISSHLRVGRALSVWLGAPLVQAAISGVLREQVNRAKAFCDERISALSQIYPIGWDLFTPNAFDMNLLSPVGILSRLPHGLVGGPSGPNLPIAGGRALMVDVLYPVRLPKASVDALLSMLYQVVEQADDFSSSMRSETDASIPPLRRPRSITVNTSPPDDYLYDVKTLPGIPYISPNDTSVRLPNSRDVLRNLGLGEWDLHTATEVKDVIAANPSLESIPVRVTGPKGSDLVPCVRSLDEVEVMGVWAIDPLESLCMALGVSKYLLGDSLAGFSSIHSLGLRMLADRLSLLGELRTTDGSSKTPKTIVIAPTNEHYYHGENHSNNIDPDGILLGTTASEHTIKFHRFLTIPSSAHIATFETNLHLYAKSDTVPSPTFSVRWFKEGNIDGTTHEIVGWTRASDAVQDVVLIPSSQPFSGCKLLLDPNGRLMGARIDNAIMSFAGGDSIWSPEVSSLESFTKMT
jgi:hypothetical protein